MKKCTQCGQEKELSGFNKNKNSKDGHQAECKCCESARNKAYYQKHKERIKQQAKKWRENNPEKKKQNDSNWQKANRDRCNEANRRYRIKHVEKIKKKYQWKIEEHRIKKQDYYRRNRDAILKKNLEYQYQTRDKRNARQRKRRQTDVQFRISSAMSKALSRALTNKAGKKWETLVGYTAADLKQHLESQFTPEMSWDNYGSYWHIDHLVPQYYFDYDSYEHPHFKACWSLDNLQPLEAEKNLRKNRHVIQL